jgi:prepilin-type N-terminal cleavage/methylation domain-containing protein
MNKRRASQAGFTLIELLVASIAGLFVVLAAFMLSRGATRLFAAEGRVANSQLNVRLGIDRLRQDLERAGYMSTPNVLADPDVCPRPAGVPLQSVVLRAGSSSTSATETPMSEANGLFPDRITIAGNFASTDIYIAGAIVPSSGGGGVDIILQKNWGSTARLLSASETSTALTALSSIFAPDRLIRIRNNVGVSQFLVISGAAIDATGRPVITTKAAPAYTTASDAAQGDKRCGGTALCLGCEVNPVQLIRYHIGALTDAKFAWAYPTGSIGDTHKYDLIRSELNPDGTVVPDSEEIVAEYAVDLAFAFGVDSSASVVPGGAWVEPVLESLAFGSANNMLYGASVNTSATSRPHRIRSIRYRLTTRTRFPDYNAATDDGGAGLGRYKLATDQYSRARTITGDVALMNQQGIRW